MCDFDAQGNLYFTEARNHCIRRVDNATGIITTVAGTGAEGYSGDGGPAVAATLNQLYARALTPTTTSTSLTVLTPRYAG